MIKRIRFATRHPALSPAAFGGAWPTVAGAAGQAPPDARPARIAVSTTLADLGDPGGEARHDGVGLESFADAAHLARFEAWLDTPAGNDATSQLDQVVAPEASPVVVADELVLRGPDWLRQRWADGGPAFKHLSIALRSADLTPAEFSERWRNHAGQVGGASRPAPIPEAVRGLAYVQNHPRPRASGEWAYDALNEVYFDDVDRLRERVDWFRANVPDRSGTDFVRRSWFLAAYEEVL